ncbi:MAG: hypothetical protein AB7Q29_16135 [Vicinamibacterales bacterium]
MISRLEFLAALPGMGFLARFFPRCEGCGEPWGGARLGLKLCDRCSQAELLEALRVLTDRAYPPVEPDDYVVFAEPHPSCDPMVAYHDGYRPFWIGEQGFYRLADAIEAAEEGAVILVVPPHPVIPVPVLR